MRRLLLESGFIRMYVAAVFIAAAFLSCANRVIDGPVSPVIDKGASIPVSATASVEEPSPQAPALVDKGAVPEATPLAALPPGYVDPWFLVAEVKGERVYSVFVDTGSIEEGSSGVESRNKLVFEESQRDRDGLLYREVSIDSSIDCIEKTYTYNTSKFYDSIGRLVYHEDITNNRTAITPDTLSAYIADFVCGYVYGNESE